MSTKINVIVGDQRLLQNNKTRAAANQQALDSRTQQQQLEQQSTDAVEEAAADEVRSGAPTLVTERRPAAQRRKKTPFASVQLVGLANLRLGTVPGSNQLINTPWVATSDPFPLTEVVNRVEVETKEYRPYAELLVQQSNRPITSSRVLSGGVPYTVPLDTKQLDWYTAFRADDYAPFKTDRTEQIRTPPQLPFEWTALRNTAVGVSFARGAQHTIVSSADQFIYVSTLFRVLLPPDQLTFRADDPLYYTLIGFTRVEPFPLGLNISLTRKTMLYWTTRIDTNTQPPAQDTDPSKPGILTYQDVAVYKRINTATQQTETRIELFSAADTDADASRKYYPRPSLKYLEYLYPDDPLFSVHFEALKTSTSTTQRESNARTRELFSLYFWPSFLNYSQRTGKVVALAETPNLNIKSVMTLQLSAGLSYTAALQAMGGDFFYAPRTSQFAVDTFTRSYFEQRGFTYVNDVTVDSSLFTGYNALIPVQAAS